METVKKSTNKTKKVEAQRKTPNVGVGVFIFDYSGDVPYLLLGRRKNKKGWGDGEYSLPGGNIEIGEKAAETAIREVQEETGLVIGNLAKAQFNDANYPDLDKFYITVYFTAQITGLYNVDKNGRPVATNMEPEKCEGWDWYPINNLPQPLFGGIEEILDDWDWSKEISAIEAIVHGGSEFIAPYVEPLTRLRKYLNSIDFVKGKDGKVKIIKTIGVDSVSQSAKIIANSKASIEKYVGKTIGKIGIRNILRRGK
jgi:8-oxo-dGTP diphosphatase